jgi:hypothetical protein
VILPPAIEASDGKPMAQSCPGNAPALSDRALADRPPPSAAPASRGRILIVEDELLVALTAE